MKTINTNYYSPETQVLELINEGIVCGSPNGAIDSPKEEEFNGWPSL